MYINDHDQPTVQVIRKRKEEEEEYVRRISKENFLTPRMYLHIVKTIKLSPEEIIQ